MDIPKVTKVHLLVDFHNKLHLFGWQCHDSKLALVNSLLTPHHSTSRRWRKGERSDFAAEF